MKKYRSFLLNLVFIATTLTACSGIEHKKEQPVIEENQYQLTDPEMHEILREWTPRVHIREVEDLQTDIDESSFDPIPEDKQDKLSTTIMDAPRDSRIGIMFNEAVNPFTEEKYQRIVNNYKNGRYITITDANHKDLDVTLITEDEQFYVPLNYYFEYGEVYFIKLEEEAGLMFTDKDPSIQRLTVEIEDDPSEAETYDDYQIKSNIPFIDLDNISQEDVDEDALFSFVHAGAIPVMNKGDIFQVRKENTNSMMGLDEFYGKYDSKEMVGSNMWKVYYTEPSADEIYDKLRLKGVKPIQGDGLKVLATEEYIQSQFRYSNTARGLLTFFAKQAENKDPDFLRSVMDRINIDINFNYTDNVLTFTFSIKISKFKLTEKLYMSLKYEYQKITTYDLDFDVGIKTKWYIPVGIKYKIKCVEDITESQAFYVIFDYDASTQEKTDDEIKNELQNDIDEAKAGEDNFAQELAGDEDAQQETSGNKTTIPLFSLPISIAGPLVFEIGLDFIIDITLQAYFMVKKQWKSNRVVFNFSNEGGGQSDTHQDVKSSSIWDFYFMGKAEVKLSLKLRGSLYFEGTYKYLHAEVYAEFWIKVGITGNVMVSFSSGCSEDQFVGNLSVDAYVQMGADIGFDVVIAILDYGESFNLFKTYILRFCLSNSIEAYADDANDHLDLNQTKFDLGKGGLLKFRVWDGVHCIMDTKEFGPNDTQAIIESWLGDLNVNCFTFTAADPNLLYFEDGYLCVKDGTAAEFDTSFTIHISNALSFVDDKPITVHFYAPDAHHVYIEDKDMGKYRPGATYTLPDAPEKGGYRFLNYIYEEQSLNPGDTITMPSEDIHIGISWYKIKYYTVMFYDGLNNLVKLDNHVEENTAAIAPDPEERDKYMAGYTFIGWDKDFSCVNSHLIVRGIYVKVGD